MLISVCCSKYRLYHIAKTQTTVSKWCRPKWSQKKVTRSVKKKCSIILHFVSRFSSSETKLFFKMYFLFFNHGSNWSSFFKTRAKQNWQRSILTLLRSLMTNDIIVKGSWKVSALFSSHHSFKKRLKSGRGVLRSGGGRGETDSFRFQTVSFRSHPVKNK